jgi:hypothetical protein
MEATKVTPTKLEVTTEINRYLEVYSLEQLNFLHELIKTFSTDHLSKGDMMKFIRTPEHDGKCDSALPIDYVRAIHELLPSFNPVFYCYDYSGKNSYGEMLNLAEAITTKMANVLTHKNFEN